MKTKTITLYNFNELSKEAQEKAHQDWINNNDYYYLGDCLNEWLHELLVENNIKDLNDTSKPGTKPTQVLYSLTCSQGDGCMFEGEFRWKDWYITIKHSGHYYHSNSKTVSWNYNEEPTDRQPSEKVEAQFESIYQSICKELENRGYDFIEQEDSLENFIEVCDGNEYTFLSSGKMEN